MNLCLCYFGGKKYFQIRRLSNYYFYFHNLRMTNGVTLCAGSQSVKGIWDPSAVFHLNNTIQCNRWLLLARRPPLSFSFGPPRENVWASSIHTLWYSSCQYVFLKMVCDSPINIEMRKCITLLMSNCCTWIEQTCCRWCGHFFLQFQRKKTL